MVAAERGFAIREIAAAGRPGGDLLDSLAMDPAWTVEGGCHCGAVRFRVSIEGARLSECNCSMCAKKGILHVIVPPERFELLKGAEMLSEYRFNTRVAVHRFCRVCGIHPFYTPRSDPDKIDVNARCLDSEIWRELPRHTFDGQNWEASQAADKARRHD